MFFFSDSGNSMVSVLMMLIGALYPIGSIAQGAIADEIGLRATTTGAAVLLAALLLTWRVLRPHAADAIGDTITTAASTGGPDAVVSRVLDVPPARNLEGG